MAGWIGVDLDGTLAHFDRWRGPRHIGLPIPAMAKRVHDWHERGVEVRIFTARASRPELIPDVHTWLKRHGFPPLAVTNQKDFGMVELWDDRAIQVLFNTGKAVRPNKLEDKGQADIFDPDQEVADDSQDSREIEPTPEEVEEFKRSIRASSSESLGDLLDALDDGDYQPGDAGGNVPSPGVVNNAPSASAVSANPAQPKNAIPEVSLADARRDAIIDDDDDLDFEAAPDNIDSLNKNKTATPEPRSLDDTLDDQPAIEEPEWEAINRGARGQARQPQADQRASTFIVEPEDDDVHGFGGFDSDEFDDLPSLNVERR